MNRRKFMEFAAVLPGVTLAQRVMADDEIDKKEYSEDDAKTCAVLFRRKLSARFNRDAFISDATGRILMLTQPYGYTCSIYSGFEERYTEIGVVDVNHAPTYCWVRFDPIVLWTDRAIPKEFFRQVNGLCVPHWI